jgi:hypothetical protein
MNYVRVFVLLFVGVFLAGCTTPTDYTAFKKMRPKSILVLPPVNRSVDASATYGYLTTITKPLAEQGYYVFPVSVVDSFLKENGLPTPVEMRTVSLKKVDEIFGADAVLYITIYQYGTKYLLFDSITTVDARLRLVDVKTGKRLWSGHAHFSKSASGNQSSILAMAVSAAVSQVVDTVSDKAHTISYQANQAVITNPSHGLLYGPRHRLYMRDHIN